MIDAQRDSTINRILEVALREDIGMGDVTTDAIVSANTVGRGTILVKEQGVIAGLEAAEALFQIVDAELKFRGYIRDGAQAESGTIAANVEGSLASILKAERT